jgi:hypothetical protein
MSVGKSTNIGNGLKFRDGQQEYVSVADNGQFEFDINDPFSISAVFRLGPFQSQFTDAFIHFLNRGSRNNSNEAQYFFGTNQFNGTYNFQFDYRLRDSGGNFKRIATAEDYNSNGFFAGDVIHAVGTMGSDYSSGTNIRIYMDNEDFGTGFTSIDGSESVGYFNSELWFGRAKRANTNYYTNDELFSVVIFNQELTAQDVDSLYKNNNQPLAAGFSASQILGNWQFNQSSGALVPDLSGNGYHGALQNFGASSDYGGGAWVDQNGNTAL